MNEQIIINYTKEDDRYLFTISYTDIKIVKIIEGEKEQLFIEELKTIIKKYTE